MHFGTYTHLSLSIYIYDGVYFVVSANLGITSHHGNFRCLSTLAAVDDCGYQNDVFSHLIHVPIPVFDAESDSDRVEAKFGQK